MSRDMVVLLVSRSAAERIDTVEWLRRFGYEVFPAKDARAATELLRTQPNVSVIVAEAELDGDLAFVHTARALNPKLIVIYTSSQPQRLSGPVKVKDAPMIRTPYHPHQIAALITDMRQQPSSGLGRGVMRGANTEAQLDLV